MSEEGGRARFRISRFNRLKKERINSFFAGVTDFHRSDVPSTMLSHSCDAAVASGARRWLNSVLIAVRSGFAGESGINRTSRPTARVSEKSFATWRHSYRVLRLTANIADAWTPEDPNQL